MPRNHDITQATSSRFAPGAASVPEAAKPDSDTANTDKTPKSNADQDAKSSVDGGSNKAMPAGVSRWSNSSVAALVVGAVLAASFYAIVFGLTAIPATTGLASPLRRYFLGHPVAIAATILFCLAVGTLALKWLAILHEKNLFEGILDEHVSPPATDGQSPAQNWVHDHDAGLVANAWIASLCELPSQVRQSQFVGRLEEILQRQSQRGSAKQLPDDLRELAARDADVAHDSLGLVRIIVWAIPMLGFLGTVIGITQTLGGLDFTNGAAAVDNLKSGLYVAFDTTALGLVLSVIAIFIQFPVERREQQLLADVDARIGTLVLANLPHGEPSDDTAVLVADLCKGVQAAVAESLQNQAKLWRDTIDEARGQWQANHDHNSNQLVDAFRVSLVPALVDHTSAINKSKQQSDQHFETLGKLEKSLEANLHQLRETSGAIDRSLASNEVIQSSTDETMADAVRTLARAVDVLSGHMSTTKSMQIAAPDSAEAIAAKTTPAAGLGLGQSTKFGRAA